MQTLYNTLLIIIPNNNNNYNATHTHTYLHYSNIEEECAKTKTSFSRSDFSIGHRGACMQFPEHTYESYKAAALQGAGIIECDVTFTKDRELVCKYYI